MPFLTTGLIWLQEGGVRDFSYQFPARLPSSTRILKKRGLHTHVQLHDGIITLCQEH